MKETILILPGFHGSGPAHWQSWLESRIQGARRVNGIDWESPVLPEWSLAIHKEIEQLDGKVWLVAHSFGCLASVVAASERPDRIAGLLLVAPADPERFSPGGARQAEDHGFHEACIDHLLPSGLEHLRSLRIDTRPDYTAPAGSGGQPCPSVTDRCNKQSRGCPKCTLLVGSAAHRLGQSAWVLYRTAGLSG
jgi:pimeloyl-ACP methyl ester carboxylesterase